MRKIVVSALIALTAVLGTAVTAVMAGPATAAPSRVSAALPPYNELFGVSCPSAKDCVAVGNDQRAFGNKGGPLIQTWNGKAWKTVSDKLPATGVAGELFDVSCKGASFCVAVGLYLNGSFTGFPLAETWHGKTWTPSTPAVPKGSTGVELNGVSCTAVNSCVAVGQYFTPSHTFVLAEVWNGSKWTASAPPLPSGIVVANLDKVSCVSAKFCVAVGTSATNTAGSVLIEVWNGKSWVRKTAVPPASSKFDATLNAVSCTSVKSCVAAGAGRAIDKPTGANGFTEVWNGKTWAGGKIPWPKGTSNSWLVGVSCASAKSCMTVGYIDVNEKASSNSGRAGAAPWNGKSWTARVVPAPAKGKASLFNEVSCPAATSCVAVGELSPQASILGTGLSGIWNGKTWKLVTTPVAS
jgi:hypothetical protein